jgi:8-oxo-dGTP diphosphatase
VSLENYKNRYKVTPAVYVMIQNTAGEVLLQRRANTTYMDGFYDFPSGHLEVGERLKDGAVRETLEEVGVIVEPKDIELFHINQNTAGEYHYMNFMFRAHAWKGEPRICEPDKCDDVGFYALDKLPKITPQLKQALESIHTKTVTFSYLSAKDFERID